MISAARPRCGCPGIAALLLSLGVCCCALLWPSSASAQSEEETRPGVCGAETGSPCDRLNLASADTEMPPSRAPGQGIGGMLGELLAPGQVLGDLHRLVALESQGSLLILGTGAALSGLALDDPDEAVFAALGPGQLGDFSDGMATLGSRMFLYPALATAFFTSKAMGDQGAATTVAQMTQALMVTDLTLTPIKFAVNRVRPDGGGLSFPSGHTAGMFAIATVLNRRYGNDVGIPAYVAATLMGAARIDNQRHFLSDVIAGAAIGIAAARVVSDRFEGRSVRVHPLFTPRGGRGLGVSLEF